MMSTADREELNWTPEQWEQARRAAEAQGRMLFRYAAQVIIGIPGNNTHAVQTASAFLVRLPGTLALATADHVVRKYECCHDVEPDLVLQVGHIGLKLAGRSNYRNASDDLAFFEVTESEAARIGSTVHTPTEWPPQVPRVNEFVTIVGLPAMIRTRPQPDLVLFGPLLATLPVLGSFADHFTCRIERECLHSVLDRPLPLHGVDYGGMSGGPVFRDAGLHFPVVGMVKEVEEELEYFVLQSFRGVPARLD